MSLFGFLAEVVTLPLKVAETAVKTTVRVAGAAVTLDSRAVEKALEDAAKDAERAAKKIEDEVG